MIKSLLVAALLVTTSTFSYACEPQSSLEEFTETGKRVGGAVVKLTPEQQNKAEAAGVKAPPGVEKPYEITLAVTPTFGFFFAVKDGCVVGATDAAPLEAIKQLLLGSSVQDQRGKI